MRSPSEPMRLAMTAVPFAKASMSGRGIGAYESVGSTREGAAPRRASSSSPFRFAPSRTCGCWARVRPSGPEPTTSMWAPGKRSSASTSVPIPASAVSGPTKMPPWRPAWRAGLFAILLGLPAPGAVLDGPRLARTRVVGRGHGGNADRLLDPRSLDRRPRLLLAGGVSVFGLLALLAPTQAARGVEVSGGGSSSTHVFFFLSSSDRHPGRSLLQQLPIRSEQAVRAIEAARGERALQYRAEQVDEGQRADDRRAPRPLGIGLQREIGRAAHRLPQHRHGHRPQAERALDHQVMQHVVERARLGARLPPVRHEELRAEVADVPRREVALREHVRPRPVEERGLAKLVAVFERVHHAGRDEGSRLGKRALQPRGCLGHVEIGGPETRLAEVGEEARVVGSEGTRLAARRIHADHEVAPPGRVRPLLQHAGYLLLELAHLLELVQPAGLAREERVGGLVGSSLHQAERKIHFLARSVIMPSARANSTLSSRPSERRSASLNTASSSGKTSASPRST